MTAASPPRRRRRRAAAQRACGFGRMVRWNAGLVVACGWARRPERQGQERSPVAKPRTRARVGAVTVSSGCRYGAAQPRCLITITKKPPMSACRRGRSAMLLLLPENEAALDHWTLLILNPSRFGREASAEVATWTSSTNDRSGLVAGHGTPGPELLAGVVVEVAASDPLVAAIAGADRKASTFDARGVIARQSALAPVQVVARLVPFDLPVPGPPRDPSATRDSLPLPARPGQLAW